MVYRALVLCALICCTLVSLSFALFAVDQASTASKQQVTELSTGTAPVPNAARAKPKQPRRFIDGAARTLTSPFRSLVSSSSQWTAEIFSTLVALLVYGLGLGYLARYSRVA